MLLCIALSAARWNGTLVAVKLLEWVDQVDEGVTGGTKETMEALMSTQLSHPNVVSVKSF